MHIIGLIFFWGGLLMVLGGALMCTQALLPVFAGRIVSGLGAVFVNVLMTKMITDWFAGRDIVAAMAMFVASWPLGIALGLISFPHLAASYGPVAVMETTAAVVAICLALVAFVYRAPPDVAAESARVAKELGKPKSQLFLDAIQAYLRLHRFRKLQQRVQGRKGARRIKSEEQVDRVVHDYRRARSG